MSSCHRLDCLSLVSWTGCNLHHAVPSRDYLKLPALKSISCIKARHLREVGRVVVEEGKGKGRCAHYRPRPALFVAHTPSVTTACTDDDADQEQRNDACGHAAHQGQPRARGAWLHARTVYLRSHVQCSGIIQQPFSIESSTDLRSHVPSQRCYAFAMHADTYSATRRYVIRRYEHASDQRNATEGVSLKPDL